MPSVSSGAPWALSPCLRVNGDEYAMPTIKEATDQCEYLLRNLEPLFSGDCRLTLLVRSPPEDDADIIVTRDDLGKVIDAIERLQNGVADDAVDRTR